MTDAGDAKASAKVTSATSTESKAAVPTDDPRLGDVIKIITLEDFVKHCESTKSQKPRIALVGFPYDEGTRRNNGRVGGAEGSTVVRRLAQRMGTVVNAEYEADLGRLEIYDLGDIDAKLTLEEAHVLLQKTVSKLIGLGVIPFMVGGSNDQSYSNASGLLDHHTDNVFVVNIDAHLDVRPLKEGKAHSGSPFRQLLEDKRFKQGKDNQFVEFAAQGSQCSQAHVDYCKEHKVPIHWLSSLRNPLYPVPGVFKTLVEQGGKHAFVSFDIDSISGADAPGVSAPGTIGLTAQEAVSMAYAAGLCTNVRLFDVSEFNPKADEYRTGRLVVNIFYHFLMGVSNRGREVRGKKDWMPPPYA